MDLIVVIKSVGSKGGICVYTLAKDETCEHPPIILQSSQASKQAGRASKHFE